MFSLCTCLMLMYLTCFTRGGVLDESPEDKNYHPSRTMEFSNPKNFDEGELYGNYWILKSQEALRARLNGAANVGVAKNVIMFIGDGMSVATLAAARTLLGQREGRPGEEASLAFEDFPATGLAKTYCVNYQIPDSACTATAYLAGVKNNYGTIGVDARVAQSDCRASTDNSTHVSSIGAWALRAGRDAGVVTTTRITHASPAGTYANTANRNWENDAEVRNNDEDPEVCRDIAYQLVHGFPGNQFKVILGGGLRNFRPQTPSYSQGRRLDNRDLVEEWEDIKRSLNVSYSYVTNLQQLRNVDINKTDYLLGLFANNHLPYHMEANSNTDPSLEEMTEIAIEMLSKNDRGYFLFVEGGRIDHAHHDNYIHLALDETIELSKAVARARALTSEQDTLIVVTADHSHVMAFNGYAPRGSDILGASGDVDQNGVPYMTLSYTNGPGFRPHSSPGIRPDVTKEAAYGNERWQPHVDFKRDSETHGGEDVAVFASGPQQHAFTGLYEQSQLPHLMAYAACLGGGLHAPACSATQLA